MTDIAAIKDILSPGWRDDWRGRWGIQDTGRRPKGCTVEDCENAVHGRGLCSKHYMAQMRQRQRQAA